MDPQREAMHLYKYRVRILPALVAELAARQDELEFLELADFNKKINALILPYMKKLLKITRVSDPSLWSRTFREKALHLLVEYINGTLGFTNPRIPYLTALLRIEDEDSLQFISIKRNATALKSGLTPENINSAVPVLILILNDAYSDEYFETMGIALARTA